MDLDAIYQRGVLAVFALAVVAFPILFWITVPYGGRHTSERWGPGIPSRLAWFGMELPAPVCFLLAYAQGRHAGDPVSLVFATAFSIHYAHRTLVYPLLIRGRGRRTPLSSAAIAMGVNVVNGGINGLAVGQAGDYDASWLLDPRFVLGTLLFLGGALVNLQSDAILRRLRGPGESGYRIPYGGLYGWVSSPNYLGEIVQWAGWALATWTAGGAAFLALTIANLAPRARSHQRWYQQHFPDYPRERRTLVPFLW